MPLLAPLVVLKTLVLLLRRRQLHTVTAQGFSVQAWVQGGVFEKNISAGGTA